MKTRICNKCKQKKDITEFHKNGKSKGQLIYRYVCKSCYNSTNRIGTPNTNNNPPTLNELSYNLLHYSRFDENRLSHITERDFLNTYKFIQPYLNKENITFEEIKNNANNILLNVYGAKHPQLLNIEEEGKYLIVSDCHGKHTKTKTFKLLHTIIDNCKIKNIIHIGHLLDDDDDINYHWKEFDNLIILAKKEELRKILSKENELNTNTKIIREEIIIDNISIKNQDIFTNEYTKTSISSLDARLYNKHTIFNFHKHEMTSKPTYMDNSVLYMSPGCLCEPFVSKTRKTIEWLDGKRVKECYADTYHTLRRYDEMSKLWEQGLYIINFYRDNTYPVPCRIKDIDKDNKGILYYNNIFTSSDKIKPEILNLITADTHIPFQNTYILSVIDNLAKKIKFTNHIHLGDICHNQSINHFSLDKNKISEIINTDFMEDVSNTSRLLSLMENWGEHNYLLYANHERFIKDFTDKYPQLKSLFNLNSLFNLKNYTLIDHKQSLVINNIRYLHGDIPIYNCSGKVQEKISKIYNGYNNPVVMGHIHYPSIQSGCYSVGLTGNKYQGYNEKDACNWIHGFGISGTYKDINWCSTIPILNIKNIANSKWDNKKLKGVNMSYEFY